MPHVDANGATIYSKTEADQNADPTMPNGEALREAWWTLRRGVPTASEFSSILTPKTGKLSAAADTYIARLIGDSLSLEYPTKEEYESFAMRRGSRIEPQARRWLEFDQNVKIEQVGFVMSPCGRFGCSPDGLRGEHSGIELKVPMPHTQASWLLDGTIPPEHAGQVHGSMVVTGRREWFFCSFSPGLPPLLVKATWNEYTDKLKDALDGFWSRYQESLATVKSM